MDISLVFLAGGHGSRFKNELPKQFHTLGKKIIALHSFEILKKALSIQEIVIVCSPEYRHFFTAEFPLSFALPGDERYLSVKNGIEMLSDKESLVLIHDAARPNLVEKDIERLMQAATQTGAATLGAPVVQTIKMVDEKTQVIKTIPRQTLWEAHTPQCILKSLLKKGLEYHLKNNLPVTDDVSLVEPLNVTVQMVHSSTNNIKITYEEDLAVAKTLLHV